MYFGALIIPGNVKKQHKDDADDAIDDGFLWFFGTPLTTDH